MKSKTLPIFLVFLAMGFGDVVGPMVSLSKETFHLSNAMAQLLPFVGFLMFGLLSVPMGIFQDKKGKKYVLNLGLIIAFIGLLAPILIGMNGKFTPNSGSSFEFYFLLLSILLLGAGAAILQVSGNPIMRIVSKEGDYSRNLSLAQSFKAIGSSLGFLLPPFVAWAFGLDWTILFPVYSAIILLTILLVNISSIREPVQKNDKHPASLSSCFRLLATNKYALMMVLGIFFYVGAEVSVSSGVPILMKEHFNITEFGLWVSWSLFFLPILIGRFVGSFILKWLKPKRFLLYTVLLSILGIGLIFVDIKIIVFIGIFCVGLGFANIFPLIFSITVDALPERDNELSGLMVTAIVGGALIPFVMGLIADSSTILVGFLAPLVCLGYLGFIAFRNIKIVANK